MGAPSCALLATRVYYVKLRSLILKFENMATPFTAGTSLVPFRVAPPSRLPSCPILIQMVPLKVVTVLFRSSTAATCTGGEIMAPGAVLVGSTANASLVDGPGGGGVAVTSNALLASPARGAAAAASVYPVPIWSIRKLAKVATPFTAATSVVPVRRPPLTRPPLWPMATVTVPVKLVTTFPAESNAVTCTGGWMVLSFICVLSG